MPVRGPFWGPSLSSFTMFRRNKIIHNKALSSGFPPALATGGSQKPVAEHGKPLGGDRWLWQKKPLGGARLQNGHNVNHSKAVL